MTTFIAVPAPTDWIHPQGGVLYLLLVSIPIVYDRVYQFNLGEIGLTYISQIVASFAAVPIAHYCDKIYHRKVEAYGPEARMYTGMAGGILFPLGCWWFAWTSWPSVHWLVPLVGIVFLYAGLLLVYLTAFNYLADSYTLYAASALAAMNVCRNTLGAIVPLFGTNVYDALGVHGAGSLVAGIATLLSLVPFLIFKYGSRLRARSKFAKELAQIETERAEQEENKVEKQRLSQPQARITV